MTHLLLTSVGLWLACTVYCAERNEIDVLVDGRVVSSAQQVPEELRRLFAQKDLPSFESLRNCYLDLQETRLLDPKSAPPIRMNANELASSENDTAADLSESQVSELRSWFKDNTKLREKLLVAIVPGTDDYSKVGKVLLALKSKCPRLEGLDNLLISFAVVWDTEQHPRWVQTKGIPELQKLPPQAPEVTTSFEWYIKNSSRMPPWFNSTPWRLQKYLAAESLPLGERQWAMSKYQRFTPTLGLEYSKILYDKNKTNGREGRIGANPYTLENLAKYGGLCRDQAFYARSICRTFGVPAFYASGESNRSRRHAWVGWIVKEGNTFNVKSEGRYTNKKFFTASLIDPQSGEQTFDYFIDIVCRALVDEVKLNDAEIYFRVWQEMGETIPEGSRLALLLGAIKKCPYYCPAWLAVGDAVSRGALPQNVAASHWKNLEQTFQDFPDFVASMVPLFSNMLKTNIEKQAFYESILNTFRSKGRQDLVANLRVKQINMWMDDNRRDIAMHTALKATLECAGEGEHGAIIAKLASDLCIEAKQHHVAITTIRQALLSTPAGRNRVNPYWLSLCETLRDTLLSSGDKKGAAAVQKDIESASNID